MCSLCFNPPSELCFPHQYLCWFLLYCVVLIWIDCPCSGEQLTFWGEIKHIIVVVIDDLVFFCYLFRNCSLFWWRISTCFNPYERINSSCLQSFLLMYSNSFHWIDGEWHHKTEMKKNQGQNQSRIKWQWRRDISGQLLQWKKDWKRK